MEIYRPYIDFSILEDGTLWLLGPPIVPGDVGDGAGNKVYHIDGNGNILSMFDHWRLSSDYGEGISASYDKNLYGFIRLRVIYMNTTLREI